MCPDVAKRAGGRTSPRGRARLASLPCNSLLLLHNHVATSLGQHGDCLGLLRATQTGACPVSQGPPAPGYQSVGPVRNWATQQEAMAGGPAKPPLCLQRLPAPGPPQLRLTPSDIRATEPWVPGATKAVARRHKLHWTMTRHAHHCGNATVTILAPTS